MQHRTAAIYMLRLDIILTFFPFCSEVAVHLTVIEAAGRMGAEYYTAKTSARKKNSRKGNCQHKHSMNFLFCSTHLQPILTLFFLGSVLQSQQID